MSTSLLFDIGKNDWEAPAQLFAELHHEFQFDLDVAANALHDVRACSAKGPRADRRLVANLKE